MLHFPSTESHWVLCREVLECFKRRELLQWTEFLVKYEEVLREGMPDCSATEVFVSDTELGKHQWEDLRKRVIEHVSSIVLCVNF